MDHWPGLEVACVCGGGLVLTFVWWFGPEGFREVEKLSPDCITRSRTENFLERDANGENKSFEELEASWGRVS